MVEKLHQIKELDDRCLPIRNLPLIEQGLNSDDVNVKKEKCVQTIDKQV